jgi:membrane AbrB-like protein
MVIVQSAKKILNNVWFILISSIGGFLLSRTGVSIGWMIGSLILAGVLAFWKPKFVFFQQKNFRLMKHWMWIGQFIVGIQLGQKMNTSVWRVFHEDGLIVVSMLILSIGFSLLSGFILWRFSSTDFMTSFVGTAPGGLSAMPGIASEVGANPAIVSLTQMVRVLLVTGTVPIFISMWVLHASNTFRNGSRTIADLQTADPNIAWTAVLVVFALAGTYLGKRIRIPAPRLVGGMIFVAIVQTLGGVLNGHDLNAWWPSWLIIIAQILMGASIGSSLNKEMFQGVQRIFLVGLAGSLALVITTTACAYIVSRFTDIELATSVLAFAPGGIAEMATTAVILHADPTFVVAVQLLRLMIVVAILPPFFKWVNRNTHCRGLFRKAKHGQWS